MTAPAKIFIILANYSDGSGKLEESVLGVFAFSHIAQSVLTMIKETHPSKDVVLVEKEITQ